MKNIQLLKLGEACMIDSLINGHNAAVDDGLIELLKLRMFRESGEDVDVELIFECLEVASEAIDQAILRLEKLGFEKFGPLEASTKDNSFSAPNDTEHRK